MKVPSVKRQTGDTESRTGACLVSGDEGPQLAQEFGANGSQSSLTIDVEEWFHILDTPASPKMREWESLECRVDRSVERLLEILDEHGTRATLFWLGWVAKRHPKLVRACVDAGHEIASHGHAHLLAYQVGFRAFRDDAVVAKRILEDISGRPVKGFRAPGFGITDGTKWAFEAIREAGYEYDASVFPTTRGHGGMPESRAAPHIIETASGPLAELPMSVVEVFGRRACIFSGGYLRITPIWLIRWGIARLRRANRPLIVLVHSREIDPDHPRLKLSPKRRFKCYVNLKSTLPKLEWLCTDYQFCSMQQLAEQILPVTPDRPK